MVAAAGRALAALDATAQQLPNPYLLRIPSLRREAQSTSALEGTYAPLREVLTAADDAPATAEMTEILNYVRMANSGFLWTQEGRPITLSLIEDLQGELMRGTPLESASGRLGRFLIVLTLLSSGVLSEPTLTVSPWFEERRADDYDALLRVSTHGDWDTFLAFFSQGLAAAASSTRHQMLALAAVHQSLKETVRASSLRSAHALDLVDFAVANPSFTVRKVEAALGISYGRANGLVARLADIGVLDVVETGSQPRRFAAPAVLKVLLT